MSEAECLYIPSSPAVSIVPKHDDQLVRIQFLIKYVTKENESISLITSLPQGLDIIGLECQNGGFWSTRLTCRRKDLEFTFKFAVVHNETKTVLQMEHGGMRALPAVPLDVEYFVVHCSWRVTPLPVERVLTHPAFALLRSRQYRNYPAQNTQAVVRGAVNLTPYPTTDSRARRVQFEVDCFGKQAYQTIRLVGSCKRLGNWKPEEGVVMTGDVHMVAEVSLEEEDFPLEFKFVATRDKGKIPFRFPTVWESGPNRVFHPGGNASKPNLHCVEAGNFRWPEGQRWKGAMLFIKLVVHDGTARHPGVVDFRMLKDIGSWAGQTGFSGLQLSSVFYDCKLRQWGSSVFALNPILISLESLLDPVQLEEEYLAWASSAPSSNGERRTLMQLLDFKLFALTRIFDNSRESIISDIEFRQFVDSNSHWLHAHALFSYYAHREETPSFSSWFSHSFVTEDDINNTVTAYEPGELSRHLGLQQWIQFVAFKQFHECAKAIANDGVILVGEFPYSPHVNSSEVWLHRRLFVSGKCIGVPPHRQDTYQYGLNLESACYDSAAMEAEGHQFLHRRLEHMSTFFSAIHITHLAQLFAEWQVPINCESTALGMWAPSQPIHVDELRQCGLWDIDRLADPYITSDILRGLVGARAAALLEEELFVPRHARLLLQPADMGEESLLKKLKSLAVEPDVEEKVLWLRRNVVLLRDSANPQLLYPRTNLESTDSFCRLPRQEQDEVRRLAADAYRRSLPLWRDRFNRLLSVFESVNMLVFGSDQYIPPHADTVLASSGTVIISRSHRDRNMPHGLARLPTLPYLTAVHIYFPIENESLWALIKNNPFYASNMRVELGICRTPGSVPVTTQQLIQQTIRHVVTAAPTKWVCISLHDVFDMRAEEMLSYSSPSPPPTQRTPPISTSPEGALAAMSLAPPPPPTSALSIAASFPSVDVSVQRLLADTELSHTLFNYFLTSARV